MEKGDDHVKCRLVNRLYDDNNYECKEGDIVLIQSKEIQDPTPATIMNIQVNVVTFLFDDPIIGYKPITIRTKDVIMCQHYQNA